MLLVSSGIYQQLIFLCRQSLIDLQSTDKQHRRLDFESNRSHHTRYPLYKLLTATKLHKSPHHFRKGCVQDEIFCVGAISDARAIPSLFENLFALFLCEAAASFFLRRRTVKLSDYSAIFNNLLIIITLLMQPFSA